MIGRLLGLEVGERMQASVDTDIENLLRLQNLDGGFGWWTRGRPSVPFVSIQSAISSW